VENFSFLIWLLDRALEGFEERRISFYEVVEMSPSDIFARRYF
jgi:hypothetical protein